MTDSHLLVTAIYSGGQNAVPNTPTAVQSCVVDGAEWWLHHALNMIPDAEIGEITSSYWYPVTSWVVLHFDSFKDPMALANWLIGYWETRKSIFQEWAFLPLIQSGEGAFTQEDVKHLNSGFVMLLLEDQHGQAILYHHQGRLMKPAFLDSQKWLWCFFYLLSAASEINHMWQKELLLGQEDTCCNLWWEDHQSSDWSPS